MGRPRGRRRVRVRGRPRGTSTQGLFRWPQAFSTGRREEAGARRREGPLGFREPRVPEARFPRAPLLGSSVNRGNTLLPQHVGSRLTKYLRSASAPCLTKKPPEV